MGSTRLGHLGRVLLGSVLATALAVSVAGCVRDERLGQRDSSPFGPAKEPLAEQAARFAGHPVTGLQEGLAKNDSPLQVYVDDNSDTFEVDRRTNRIVTFQRGPTTPPSPGATVGTATALAVGNEYVSGLGISPSAFEFEVDAERTGLRRPAYVLTYRQYVHRTLRTFNSVRLSIDARDGSVTYANVVIRRIAVDLDPRVDAAAAIRAATEFLPGSRAVGRPSLAVVLMPDERQLLVWEVRLLTPKGAEHVQVSAGSGEVIP